MARIISKASAIKYLMALLLTMAVASNTALADHEDSLDEIIADELLGELDGNMGPARVICDCRCVSGVPEGGEEFLCLNNPVPPVAKTADACDVHFEIPATAETNCEKLERTECRGYSQNGKRRKGLMQHCRKLVIAQE